MKTIRNLTLVTLLFSLTVSCNGQGNKITKPKNLEEGITFFQQTWTKKQLKEFRLKDEGKALADVHFAAAMWVRNEWVRSDRNKEFKKYFNDLGVFAPDDISSILFTSLHRRLNGKDIQLNKQIERNKEYWDKINNCQQKQTEKAVGYYNQYKIADTINIYMPVDTSSGNRNAVIYGCPTTDWSFDKTVDLKFSAIVKDKYNINSTTNVFFKLEVLKMNFPKTQILMKTVTEGSEIDLNLTGLKIE
jgi:hypothetical protein